MLVLLVLLGVEVAIIHSIPPLAFDHHELFNIVLCHNECLQSNSCHVSKGFCLLLDYTFFVTITNICFEAGLSN